MVILLQCRWTTLLIYFQQIQPRYVHSELILFNCQLKVILIYKVIAIPIKNQYF